MKKLLSEDNHFVPMVLDDRIFWGCNSTMCGRHIREIVEISSIFDRRIVINTGGHGGKHGADPTFATNSEGNFIDEDLRLAINSAGQVALHTVSNYASPIYPRNIDVINAWCSSV